MAQSIQATGSARFLPAVAFCSGRCADHPACLGRVRERPVMEWVRGSGVRREYECDRCTARFDRDLRYLGHHPRI